MIINEFQYLRINELKTSVYSSLLQFTVSSLVFDPAHSLLDFLRRPLVLLHVVCVSDVDPEVLL